MLNRWWNRAVVGAVNATVEKRAVLEPAARTAAREHLAEVRVLLAAEAEGSRADDPVRDALDAVNAAARFLDEARRAGTQGDSR